MGWERLQQPDGRWFWRNILTHTLQYTCPKDLPNEISMASHNLQICDLQARMEKLEQGIRSAHPLVCTGQLDIVCSELLQDNIPHGITFKTPFSNPPVITVNTHCGYRCSVVLGKTTCTGFQMFIQYEDTETFEEDVKEQTRLKLPLVTIRWVAHAMKQQNSPIGSE